MLPLQSPVNSPFRWKRDKLIALRNELKCKQALLDCKFVVITGDLNFSKTSWDSMESTDHYEQSILDILCEQGFNQILEHNNEKSLDVFLCNDDENVYMTNENKQIASHYNVSDHSAYITTIQLTVNRWTPVKRQQVYSFKSANCESFVTGTLENPFQPYCYSNIDVLLQTWYSWFHDIMEDNLKKVTTHRMYQASWITNKTSRLQNLLKTKTKKKKKKNNFNVSQALKIKKLEKQVSKSIEDDLKLYEAKIFEICYFSHIQKYLSCIRKNPAIPCQVYNKERAAVSDCAEMFNNFFASVFNTTGTTHDADLAEMPSTGSGSTSCM